MTEYNKFLDELDLYCNSRRGNARGLCIALGKNENFIHNIRHRIQKANSDEMSNTIFLINSNSFNPEKNSIKKLREFCKVWGNQKRLAEHLGITKQAMSRKLRNESHPLNEQWYNIQKFIEANS